MNCVNCGAAMAPVGNRSYFRCPYCETFHFPEETGDGVAQLVGEAQFDCPVCEQRLTRAAIDGHEVSYCVTCRGFLAANGTFGRVVGLKRAQQTPQPHVAVPFAQEELKRRIACPKCRKPMDAHPYHAGGNAVIDTCHRCHLVWLDAGELTVIGSYTGRGAPPVRNINADGSPAPAAPPPQEEEPVPVYFNLFGFQIRVG
jgi:Zn-finger nucleic acid-binding protein